MPIASTSGRSLRRPELHRRKRAAASGGLARFSTSLRELGLYDSSLIVISSDHGVALPPQGFTGDRDVFGGPAVGTVGQRPGAARGEAASAQDLFASQRHRAPSPIFPRPSSIRSGLKNPFPGISALKLDEHAPRPRQFAVYLWSSSEWQADFFPYMDVFTVDGASATAAHGRQKSPSTRRRRHRNTARADFTGRTRRARRDVQMEHAARALLHQPPGARGVELKVRSKADKPQTLTIELRGKVIDKRVLSDTNGIR